GELEPHVVVQIPSYGETRLYAKEQALIDLLKAELAAGRPCVVYLRQTATKDIQPRIESLIRQHVPSAVPYTLKNTVQAERREQVIEGQIGAGVNVVICNPELVKTGLDLIHFPTLIFYEITFNLGTMMQAAARAYRLNQTHKRCKTYYIFAEGTMEHTAVQLMSRKQRAAKLLTGDIGLTGLDALTEGELGFEEALLDAIAKDETLLDPSEMFKVSAGQGEIDAEDAAYWHGAVAAEAADETPPTASQDIDQDTERLTRHVVNYLGSVSPAGPDIERLTRYVGNYLDGVHLIRDEAKRMKLQAKLLAALMDGVHDDDGTRSVIGLRDPGFMKHPVHAETLIRYVRGWLKQNRFVSMGCEDEAAAKIVDLAQQALGLKPIQLSMLDVQDKKRSASYQPKRHKVDLLAVPDERPDERTEAAAPKRPLAPKPAAKLVQLTMF
ncbi:MAG: helicase-related protein, partial [Anaerolineae bacterium]